MTPTVTYNEFNLGDQLIFLHLLRALAKANPSRVFYHFTHPHHAEQLAVVTQDISNIEIFALGTPLWQEYAGRAVNCWKNADDYWVRSKFRWDWSAFTLNHHQHIAGLLKLRSPLTIRENLLFDYPALNPNNIPGGQYFYDFLMINSEPCSGQFGPMRQHGTGYMDEFVKQLSKKFSVITTNPVHGVECTRDSKKSVTDIGRLSLKCRNHVMVATGPMWATLNTTNHHHSAGRKRIVLLDNGEDLNMPGVIQCTTLGHVRDIAKQEKWL